MLRRAMSAAIMISVALMADLSGLTRHADNWFTGIRMANQARAPSGETVLVDIDAKSIEAMGSWPWPRRVHAELIDRLVALDAAEIAFDVDFSAPSNADDDAALEAALGRAGGSVILAVFRQWRTADADDGDVLNQPLDRFAKNAWTASVNARQDSDGVVRRYPYGAVVDDLTVPSIPVMLAAPCSGPPHMHHATFFCPQRSCPGALPRSRPPVPKSNRAGRPAQSRSPSSPPSQ